MWIEVRRAIKLRFLLQLLFACVLQSLGHSSRETGNVNAVFISFEKGPQMSWNLCFSHALGCGLLVPLWQQTPSFSTHLAYQPISQSFRNTLSPARKTNSDKNGDRHGPLSSVSGRTQRRRAALTFQASGGGNHRNVRCGHDIFQSFYLLHYRKF